MAIRKLDSVDMNPPGFVAHGGPAVLFAAELVIREPGATMPEAIGFAKLPQRGPATPLRPDLAGAKKQARGLPKQTPRPSNLSGGYWPAAQAFLTGSQFVPRHAEQAALSGSAAQSARHFFAPHQL